MEKEGIKRRVRKRGARGGEKEEESEGKRDDDGSCGGDWIVKNVFF